MPGYYHCSVQVIGRAQGRSAVASAAYRAGDNLADERYGKTHDYERKSGIAATGIEAPANAPAWMRDRENLWNAVEAGEKRKDAQLAREFELGFPHQLTAEQRREVLQEFIAEEFTRQGLVSDWAIHAPNRAGDQRNWHAHVMTSMRRVEEDGFSPSKARDLNSTEQIEAWREAWAGAVNRACEKHNLRDADGKVLRIDHRSYADRGIDQEPTMHMGVHANAMERRGIPTEIGGQNRDIELANMARVAIRRQADELTREQVQLMLGPPGAAPVPRLAQFRQANDNEILAPSEKAQNLETMFDRQKHGADPPAKVAPDANSEGSAPDLRSEKRRRLDEALERQRAEREQERGHQP